MIAEVIRGGRSRKPIFETAVGLYRSLEALEHSSATGREADAVRPSNSEAAYGIAQPRAGPKVWNIHWARPSNSRSACR